jgi:cytochrome c biogenesis protein CcdA
MAKGCEMILEELFVALIIGTSFSNAMVCILLGFSTSTSNNKNTTGATASSNRLAILRNTGLYFIFGRFLGLILICLVIASIGVFFEGQIFYLLVIFGALTILFGAFIIFKMYYRYKHHGLGAGSGSGNMSCGQKNNVKPGHGLCSVFGLGKGRIKHKTNDINANANTNRYSFFLGMFRGATPCLKIFILAPLLIIVDFQLALLMLIV